MPSARRRSEIEIAGEILENLLEEEERRDDPPKISRIQARVYLNWTTLNRHLDALREKGLVAADDLRLTERGHRFLESYNRNVRSLLGHYGFLDSEFPTGSDDS